MLPSIITFLAGIACFVQGLTITFPTHGDKINIQNGLTISWTTDSSDNPSANATIDLFLDETFYMALTQRAVPITDFNYTFQYTSDRGYIDNRDGYIVRMYDGAGDEYESGEFGIDNTANFVKAVIASAISTTPISTLNNPSGTPLRSASASGPAPSSRATTTPSTRHPTPSVVANAANELMHGDMRSDTIAFVAIAFPLIYILVLLCVR